jgi:acetyltransferase-like isoleucine patch superfamily enzyme
MITIGDNAALAGHDIVLSHDFLLSASFHSEAAKLDGFRPVIIKNGARIGAHVIILAGVVIGERSIIGAGALVVGDIPADCLAVGAPAKPVKYFK